MYLADMITKQDKKAQVNYILSTVLKIKQEKSIRDQIKDREETVKFLSEKMIREVERAFKK